MMTSPHPGRPHRAAPTHTSRLILGPLLLAILSAQTLIAGPREPVALVYQVSGEAQRTAPGRSPEPLRLYDRLPAGVTLELKPGARVSLAFAIGKRYELSGPASATLGKEDLAARSGGVKALAPVPPLPQLEPIAASEKPGATAGAILIRGGEAGAGSLSKEDAEARERLREAVEALGDDDSPALLAAVDHVLGLAAKPPAAPEPPKGAPCSLSTPGLVIETVAPESAAFR